MRPPAVARFTDIVVIAGLSHGPEVLELVLIPRQRDCEGPTAPVAYGPAGGKHPMGQGHHSCCQQAMLIGFAIVSCDAAGHRVGCSP